MDDLGLLRDLGHDLEHEPPATLVRQRHRLAEAIAGRTGRHRGRGWILIGVAAAVTAALILVPTVLLRGGGKGAEDPLGRSTHRAGATKALNILVLGTDGRGDKFAPRSDTIVLLHLPRDNERISAVSIPRDLMVPLPSCKTRSGEATAARTGLINSAYTVGGLGCSVRAVEKLTDVRIDHAMSIDFTGFKRIVSGMGGVEVVVPRAMRDPKAGLNLSPGRQMIRGDQALAYARARQGLGDGSDLERIKRQQQLMAAMLKRAKEKQMLSPVRLPMFLNMMAGTMETYGQLSVPVMKEIARILERTETDTARFSTIPVRPHPDDPNRLALNEPTARKLLQTFRS
ncbi:LCP family protein [Actinomadura rudentiformis]|uniref:LytR family transcriptional regulator n=1 Tax=Actinomadura rudentiformis TaxID=359158 RepID=A0A6H9Z2W1_9ACTN|nr:LCP family protein [Actinomadura rudentiformis]KAB2351381.1 LytR family transcriptional regulator [Actinomadura rudentiformis]